MIIILIIMEEIYGKNHKMIMKRTQMDTDSLTTNYLQKQTMLQQNQEVIINEVFEAVRDASSTENARAIQDSESNVA